MKNLYGIEKLKWWSIYFKFVFFFKFGWYWESVVFKLWELCLGSLEMECVKEYRICGFMIECINIGVWFVIVCGVLEYVFGI